MRFFKLFISSIFGFASLAIVLLSIPTFFYFEYFTAKHDHWIAFVAGLILPPVSVIGGILVWLGWIWHTSPSQEPSFEAQQIMQSSTTFGMLSTAANRRKWNNFSRKDIEIADSMQNTLLRKLKDSFAFSEDDIQAGRDAARKSGKAINCEDQAAREGMRRWMNGIEAMGR